MHPHAPLLFIAGSPRIRDGRRLAKVLDLASNVLFYDNWERLRHWGGRQVKRAGEAGERCQPAVEGVIRGGGRGQSR